MTKITGEALIALNAELGSPSAPAMALPIAISALAFRKPPVVVRRNERTALAKTKAAPRPEPAPPEIRENRRRLRPMSRAMPGEGVSERVGHYLMDHTNFVPGSFGRQSLEG